MSGFLAEVQQLRESRRRGAKARRADRRQAAAGPRGAAASEAAQQARKARRMETEAAMLRRRAMAAAGEGGSVSAAATGSVEEHLSPDSVLLQVLQGLVRVTAKRKRPAPSAEPVPSASLPLDAGRHIHDGASEPDAASDSSQSDSSASGERSGSPGIGDGSEADSASAFEFVSTNDAGASVAAQEPQQGAEEAAARPQQSGAPEPRSSTAALARETTAARPVWGAAQPQVDADPASDDESGGSPSTRKLRRSMLRRARELLPLRRRSLGSGAAAVGRDDAAAGSATLHAGPARGSEAASVHGDHAEHPEQHTDASGLSSQPASTVRFWLCPPSTGCGVPPSSAGSGELEQPGMQGLDDERRQAGDLATRGADLAAQLLGAQRSQWHYDGKHHLYSALRWLECCWHALDWWLYFRCRVQAHLRNGKQRVVAGERAKP